MNSETAGRGGLEAIVVRDDAEDTYDDGRYHAPDPASGVRCPDCNHVPPTVNHLTVHRLRQCPGDVEMILRTIDPAVRRRRRAAIRPPSFLAPSNRAA